jgi:hypothetical protein
MTSRKNDNANRTVVYRILCMLYCYIYSTVLLFWQRFRLKTIPLQAWTGPEGSRWLRLPDF